MSRKFHFLVRLCKIIKRQQESDVICHFCHPIDFCITLSQQHVYTVYTSHVHIDMQKNILDNCQGYLRFPTHSHFETYIQSSTGQVRKNVGCLSDCVFTLSHSINVN